MKKNNNSNNDLFKLSFTPDETNQIFIDEINSAEKFIIIHAMFFNTKNMKINIVNLLNNKFIKTPNIYIELNLGVNPFDKHCFDGLDNRVIVNVIKMRTIFMYVHHIRLFHTEKVMCIGGVDFIEKILNNPHYIQFSLFIKNNKYFILNKNKHINIEIKNFYNYTNIGYNKNSYVKQILHCIKYAETNIFIDCQYCAHKEIIYSLIEKKKNSPSINITILTNSMNSKPNPLNKCFNNKLIFFIFDKFILKKMEKIGIKFIKHNFYTHNKIFIFDKKYIMIGSMNIIPRSIECNGGDREIGIFIKNHIIAEELLEYYMKL